MCVCVLWPEDGVRTSGAGVAVVVSSHVVLGPLQEQQVLLTAETSL